MRICVLSQREVGRFNNYHQLPNHSEHVHVSWQQAVKMVQADTYRMVGKDQQGECEGIGITEQSSNDRVWRSRLSAGAAVLQLVRP